MVEEELMPEPEGPLPLSQWTVAQLEAWLANVMGYRSQRRLAAT